MTTPALVLQPSDAELLATFATIVSKSLRIDAARVVPAASLDELGAESLDLLEITLEVENTFGILMPERTILEIAAEVLGDGALEQDGRLTALGKRFLARRMPELLADALAGDVTSQDLRQVFLRVETWLRVIRFVIDSSPRTCKSCGVGLVTGSPAKLRCPRCRVEIALPTGDDLNREWVRQYAAHSGDAGSWD